MFTQKLLLLPVMVGVFLTPDAATAQSFTNLHNFTAISSTTNGDGANPSCSLVLLGDTLYGTTEDGGISGQGAVFSVRTDGMGFTNLHSFAHSLTNRTGFYTNSEGASPAPGLLLVGNTLYGTAEFGGSNGGGTIFSIALDGTHFTNLHTFTATATNSLGIYTNADGNDPQGALIASGNTLYGTASAGGAGGSGAVFRLATDGTEFTNLYSLATHANTLRSTNSDGYYPVTSLALMGSALYGTATYGGTSSFGTLFRLNNDGTDFTNMHNFRGRPIDGSFPGGGLALSGNILYGTTEQGGSGYWGSVFAINTDGSAFTNLYSFQDGTDGASPYATLLVLGEALYGTASFGGVNGEGSIFVLNTNGADFRTLYSFTTVSGTYPLYTNSDGYNPYAGLILSDNTLYGTALEGGSANSGTVFSLALPVGPPLSISRSGVNVIVTWPADATGFTLQATTNLGPPAVWTNIDGQSPVTEPITGQKKFYRLGH